MGNWIKLFFAVILCVGGSVLAEDLVFIPADNDNHVEISNRAEGHVVGGAAERQVYVSDVADDAFSGNVEANGNIIEIREGGSVEYAGGGEVDFDDYYYYDGTFANKVIFAADTTLSANGNQITVTDSEAGELSGASINLSVDSVDYSWLHDGVPEEPEDVPADSVDFFPMTVNGTVAAAANDNSIIIENANVTGRIEGGYVNAEVIVSDESDATITATAARNHIMIDGDATTVTGNIHGGISELYTIFGAGAAIVEDNSVTINGGTVDTERGMIMGGHASSFGYRAAYNYPDGTGRIVVHVPENSATATAMGNSVVINGGSVALREVHVGGDPDGMVYADNIGLIGGLAETETSAATASGNKVIITGGTTEIEGHGTIGGAAVSRFGSATAAENTVEITGGTVIGIIRGGAAISDSGVAKAINNTVTVGGTVDLSNASLVGGGLLSYTGSPKADDDFFTGNKLNILSDVKIRNTRNFEYLNFAYSGDSNLGTLDLSGGDVRLSVTDANTINYTGTFSGTGSLTKLGTGVLNFGSNQSIGGKMTVREGGLSILNSLSLTTNGGLLFGAGSQFTPNGNTLTVLGGVAIDRGASINLGDIDIGKTVLVSDSRIGGDFDSMFYETMMNDEMTELRVTGEFSSGDKGKNIISDLANSGVTMGKNGVKGIGQLASILGSVGPEVERELMRQLEALVDLADGGDRAAAAAGVQQILGQYSTRATQATHTVSQSFGSAVSGHLSQMRDSRMAQAGMNSAPGAQSNRAYASMRTPRNTPRYARGGYGYSSAANRIWGGGFGSFASQDDDDGDFGYDYNSGGFILGYDHYFGDNITVGFTGAYSHGTIDGNDGYSETSVDTLNFGAYASYDTPSGFYAEGNLGFGFTWNDEDERLVWGGRRSGEFTTSSFQLGGNVGYAFQLPAAFRIIPTLGLQYVHVDQDEYEQSGNVLAMWRDSSSADYVELPIAVRANKTFNFGNGVSITPELRAAWIIEAKQDDVSVRTGFVGSNASMLVAGVNPGKHRGLVGVGAKARLGGNVDAFLNYNLEFRNNYTNHNIMAGVGVSF